MAAGGVQPLNSDFLTAANYRCSTRCSICSTSNASFQMKDTIILNNWSALSNLTSWSQLIWIDGTIPFLLSFDLLFVILLSFIMILRLKFKSTQNEGMDRDWFKSSDNQWLIIPVMIFAYEYRWTFAFSFTVPFHCPCEYQSRCLHQSHWWGGTFTRLSDPVSFFWCNWNETQIRDIWREGGSGWQSRASCYMANCVGLLSNGKTATAAHGTVCWAALFTTGWTYDAPNTGYEALGRPASSECV